jgi:hypothetical protein
MPTSLSANIIVIDEDNLQERMMQTSRMSFKENHP